MLYILNTLMVPVDFNKYPQVTVKMKIISTNEAKQLVSGQNFTSAVGHEGTAQLLSKLLGISIPFNRISIYLQPGDKAVHFFLKNRLPEGQVLNEEELRRLDFWLVLSEVIK